MKSAILIMIFTGMMLPGIISAQNIYSVAIAGTVNDSIARETIINNPSVTIAGTDIPAASFQFTYMNVAGDLISMQGSNGVFSSTMLNVIRDTSVHKIWIDEVSFMQNGQEQTAQSRVIKFLD